MLELNRIKLHCHILYNYFDTLIDNIIIVCQINKFNNAALLLSAVHFLHSQD